MRSSWADFPNFPLQVDVHCDVLQVQQHRGSSRSQQGQWQAGRSSRKQQKAAESSTGVADSSTGIAAARGGKESTVQYIRALMGTGEVSTVNQEKTAA